MSNDTLLDFDSMDDVDLDSFDEAPDYLDEIPTGVYVLIVENAEKKKQKNKEGVENTFLTNTYTVARVVELDDPDELAPVLGSKFTERWTTNDQGISFWKKQTRKLLGKESLSGFTFGEALKALNNPDEPIYVKAKCSTKLTKNDKGEFKNIQVRVQEVLKSPEL